MKLTYKRGRMNSLRSSKEGHGCDMQCCCKATPPLLS